MQNGKYAEVICVVDRSGSMGSIESDAIGGYNQFLKKQQAEAGLARYTLVLFNHQYQLLYDGMDIQEAEPIDAATYAVGGTTALLDAVGTTIDRARGRIAKLPEDRRPSAVILAILTDGLENASREYTRDQLFEMITRQREECGWEIIFLAANQDAVQEGGRMGVQQKDAYDFAADGDGVRQAYSAITARTSRARRAVLDRNFAEMMKAHRRAQEMRRQQNEADSDGSQAGDAENAASRRDS